MCLQRLNNDDYIDLAVGGSRQHILNSRSFSPLNMYCFDQSEHIIGYQPVLLMRKHSPLRSKIDDIICNAFEGGLFVKWNRDNQRKKKKHEHRHKSPDKLTLKEYAFGIVLILGIGSTVSTLTFCVELIIKWQMKLRPRMPWTMYEACVDGHRYMWSHTPEILMGIKQPKYYTIVRIKYFPYFKLK